MNVRGVPSSNNSVSWVSAQVNIYIEQGYFRLFSFFAPLEISIDDGLLGSREIPNPSINPKSGLQFYSLLPQWNKFISEFAFISFHKAFFDIIVRIAVFTKGQLISKCLFGVFNFFQKTNKNKSTWGIKVVKSNYFVRFLEELRIPKSPFEINWPLRVRIK